VKAHVVVGEMNPSRIDVARRALTHEVIPNFRAQPGSGCGHWMVNRTTGELLVLTTWDDEEVMTVGLAAGRAHRGSLAERTGFGVHARHTMDVLGSTGVHLAETPLARLVRATWVEDPASVASLQRGAVDGPPPLGSCGGYALGDPATGAGLALTFWARPAPGRARDPGRHRELDPEPGVTVKRIAVYESIGLA